jgi:hypothetical protein
MVPLGEGPRRLRQSSRKTRRNDHRGTEIVEARSSIGQPPRKVARARLPPF